MGREDRGGGGGGEERKEDRAGTRAYSFIDLFLMHLALVQVLHLFLELARHKSNEVVEGAEDKPRTGRGAEGPQACA